MKLTIKSRGTKYTVEVNSQQGVRGFVYVTATMIQQVLDQLSPKMQRTFGDYRWTIVGDRGNYQIRAYYPGGCFIEASGKTPNKALIACYQVRIALD